MAYNQKQLKSDSYGKPVPQMYNPVIDDFEVLTKMEFYGKSTDVKPTPATTPLGATFMEVDTKNVYMNDGSAWSLL
jgi:hypothetical protein